MKLWAAQLPASMEAGEGSWLLERVAVGEPQRWRMLFPGVKVRSRLTPRRCFLGAGKVFGLACLIAPFQRQEQILP